MSDLDGTLLAPGGRVSDRTVHALGLARQAGVPVAFATGRPPRWIGEIARATGYHELAICSNGALVYDPASGRVLDERPLDPALGRRLVTRIGEALDSVSFGVELGDSFRCGPGYHFGGQDDSSEVRTVPEQELFVATVYKLLVQDRDCSADALLEKVAPLVGQDASVTHSGGTGLLEIAAPGVSKASTLQRFCAARGIDAAEVVAFGDMPNDLQMLAWAGTSYAMGNAHPDVHALADRQCPRNDQDGVATVLEDLFG